MEKKKTNRIVGSIFCGLITVFGIVVSAISLLNGTSDRWFLQNLCDLILLLLILFYAFIGYKKPHGNLLKYILLIRAVLSLPGIAAYIELGGTPNVIMMAAEIGIICYVAGRLSKVNENAILLGFVGVLEMVHLLMDYAMGVATIGILSMLVIWIDICIAYLLRYDQHKQAGIENPENK